MLLGGLGASGGGIGARLTAASLAKILGKTEAQVSKWVAPINKAMAKFDINTPQRVAAFLGNVRKEMGDGGIPVESTAWNLTQ